MLELIMARSQSFECDLINFPCRHSPETGLRSVMTGTGQARPGLKPLVGRDGYALLTPACISIKSNKYIV